MRSAFSCLAFASALSVFSFGAHAAPRGFAIDIDPSAPTLGELLDREAREAAFRREQQRQRAIPVPTVPPVAPTRSDVTGSISGPRISATPYIPRGAVTVILPHPKTNAGRPISHQPARR
jgi:hypothetical protein